MCFLCVETVVAGVVVCAAVAPVVKARIQSKKVKLEDTKK